jgi:hypothetical protein
MSGYAGRHRDALTGAPVPATPGHRRGRAILLAAAAVAVVVTALFAIPVLTEVNGGPPSSTTPTVPREAGLQLLGRQGDLGDLTQQRQQVGQGVTTTGTPDGPPTDSTPTPTSSETTSSSDGLSPGALTTSASSPSRSTTPTGASRTAPSTTSTTSVASATEANPRSAAKAMFPEFGFADSEFGCLNAMWNRLDRWGTVAQVRPGLAYIKSRYGTPCAAWDHVRETGQY